MSIYFVTADKKEASEYAAGIFFHGFVNSPGPFIFGTATGQTPVETYKRFKKNILKFSEDDQTRDYLIFAQLDSYIEENRENVQELPEHSYFRELSKGIWEVPNKCAVIPDEFAENPNKEAEEYECTLRKLKKNSCAYFQLLGIGDTDGHIAFNMPGTPFDSRVHVTELNRETIEANANKFFNGDTTKVPKKAITTGIADILEADCIVLEAFGSKKAEIIYKTFFEEASEEVPASALQNYEGLLFVILDEESAEVIKKEKPEVLKDLDFAESILGSEIQKIFNISGYDVKTKYDIED